jgi:DNA polymerase elongation subunit (family B)
MLKHYLNKDLNKLEIEITREDLWKPNNTKITSTWEPYKVAPLEEQLIVDLDLESTGLNAFTSQLICIGITAHDCPRIQALPWGKQLIDGIVLWAKPGDDTEPLRRFLNALDVIKPDIISSHNGYGFDWFYLRDRFELNKIPHPFVSSDESVVREVTAASINGSPPKYRDIYIDGDTYVRKWDSSTIALPGKNHKIDLVDTYILAGMLDKLTADMAEYNLKYLACDYFKGREGRRLELSYKDILDCWEKQDLAPIEEYLRYDLEDQKIVTNALLTPHYYQKMFFPITLQEICVASPAKKWNSLMEDYYGKDHRPEPDEQVDFEGGAVDAHPGTYKGWFKIDVGSLYPSINLRYGIHSHKDSHATALKVLEVVKDKRFEYKRAMQAETDPAKRKLYKGMDQSVKVVANGEFGWYGTAGYTYNSYICAANITAYGREIMNLMLEVLDRNDVVIINLDTDGIMCMQPMNGKTAEEVFQEVKDALPDGIVVELEDNYPEGGVYVSGKKNYLTCENPDSEFKGKGVFRKRNRTQMQLQTPRTLSKLAIYSTEEELTKWVSDTSQAIQSGSIAIPWVMQTKRIPKSDKTLTAAGIGGIGDKVRFYWGSTDLQMKTKVKKVRHPVAVDSDNNPIPMPGVDVTPSIHEYFTEFKKLVEDFANNTGKQFLMDQFPQKKKRSKRCKETLELDFSVSTDAQETVSL